MNEPTPNVEPCGGSREEASRAVPEGYLTLDEALQQLRTQVRARPDCPPEERLCGYVDGRLWLKDRQKARETKSHLKVCPVCRYDVNEITACLPRTAQMRAVGRRTASSARATLSEVAGWLSRRPAWSLSLIGGVALLLLATLLLRPSIWIPALTLSAATAALTPALLSLRRPERVPALTLITAAVAFWIFQAGVATGINEYPAAVPVRPGSAVAVAPGHVEKVRKALQSGDAFPPQQGALQPEELERLFPGPIVALKKKAEEKQKLEAVLGPLEAAALEKPTTIAKSASFHQTLADLYERLAALEEEPQQRQWDLMRSREERSKARDTSVRLQPKAATSSGVKP